MKRIKRLARSEAELLATFFAIDDLKAFYGTDDPVEILARVDIETIVGTNPASGWYGFEEEAQEFRELVLLAKKAKAKLDKKRLAGSLEFLAEKLAKTSRQVREYCKKGLVPEAQQTAGGHWRVNYRDDTVATVRAAIGGSCRRRADGWLIKRLRKWAEDDTPPSPDEVPFSLDRLKSRSLRAYLCAEAAHSLAAQKKKARVTAVAKMTGLSRYYSPQVPTLTLHGRDAQFHFTAIP